MSTCLSATGRRSRSVNISKDTLDSRRSNDATRSKLTKADQKEKAVLELKILTQPFFILDYYTKLTLPNNSFSE